MSELEPLSTPEELQATLSDTEPTELEQPESKVNRGGRKLGSKNLPKVDYDSRIENLISAMNMLIEKGELTATVERAYNRQIEYFQFQIQRRDDAKKESRERELAKVKELEAQPPVPVPSAPPVPAPDAETERRLAKVLKQLETPEPVQEVNPDTTKIDDERLAVERRAKEAAEKKSQEDLEKKAANDKRLARIVELNELRDGILKARNNPGTMLAGATNPTFLRDGNDSLKRIARELDVLEGRSPAKSPQRHFDPEAADRRRAAEEEEDFMNRLLEGERIVAANRVNVRPAPISGGLGMCEGPEWNR